MSLENPLKWHSQSASWTYKLPEYYILQATCVSQMQLANHVVAIPDLYISTTLHLTSSWVPHYNKAYAFSKFIKKLQTS
jgi:hypothetical protein